MILLLVGLLGTSFAYSCSPASFEVVRPDSSPREESPTTINSNLFIKSPVPCELVIYEDSTHKQTDKQKLSKYKQDLTCKIKNLEQALGQNGINVSMPSSPRDAVESLIVLLSHNKAKEPKSIITKPEESKLVSWFGKHKFLHSAIATGVIVGGIYYLKRA